MGQQILFLSTFGIRTLTPVNGFSQNGLPISWTHIYPAPREQVFTFAPCSTCLNLSGSPNLVRHLMYSSQSLVASLLCVCGGRLRSLRNFVSIRNLAPRRHRKTEDTLWPGDVISQPKFYLLPPPCINLPCLSISPTRLEHGLHLTIRERKQLNYSL